MSKGNSEWDKVCQVARWGLQISFCSLALLFELFKVCSGEMRTISMTICTVSYKEEAFFQAELLHYSAATATNNMLGGGWGWNQTKHIRFGERKNPDSINQFLSRVKNDHYKPAMSDHWTIPSFSS